MPGPVAGAIIGAGISGVASLLGGNKNAKASKSAASSQERLAREALAEQRRVYDREDAKERERYEYDRSQSEADRTKTRQDEERVRGSRQEAFGGFDSDLSRFSNGYAAPYGMSAQQAQGLMAGRVSGGGGGGSYVPPSTGDKGMGPGPDPMAPRMPQMTAGPGGQMLTGQQEPPRSSSMSSTVWLQAPTGETMEVSIQDAMPMLQAGAVLIPPPNGGQ